MTTKEYKELTNKKHKTIEDELLLHYYNPDGGM